jgi:hypothetical protein
MKINELFFAGFVALFVVGCGVKTPEKKINSSDSKIVQRPDSLKWGEKGLWGLQLGCWLDDKRPIVMCVIRNSGEFTIRYSDFFLGTSEAVGIMARQNSSEEWRRIENRFRAVAGTDGSARCLRFIRAGKEMEPQSYYEHGGTSVSELKYTFLVFLNYFEWPESWKGNIELMVKQYLGDDKLDDIKSKDIWSGTLESSILIYNIDELRKPENKLKIMIIK